MIRVNSVEINEDAIATEMQYHKAESQRDAMIQAGESLVIAELLRQRAKTLDIFDGQEGKSEPSPDDDDFSELLFQRDLEYPNATEADCRQYFEQNQEKFRNSPIFEIRHVLFSADPKDPIASTDGKDTAAKVLMALQEDLSQFDQLVKQYSSCPSKETGGQLGQISKGQTVPEFERQVFSCKEGLIASPIETRYGYHLVLIDHIIPGNDLPFEAVHTRIRDYLNEKVKRKSIAQYIEQLISAADIEGFDFNVSDSPLMN